MKKLVVVLFLLFGLFKSLPVYADNEIRNSEVSTFAQNYLTFHTSGDTANISPNTPVTILTTLSFSKDTPPKSSDLPITGHTTFVLVTIISLSTLFTAFKLRQLARGY